MRMLDVLMLRCWAALMDRQRPKGDRGDVPGWVMITILSAVLVVGLIAIAGPKLNSLFNNATDSVGTKTP